MEYKVQNETTQMSLSLPSLEKETKLLFFEHFSYPQSQYNVEEIFFSKAILLHQIRILKSDSNPHTKIKSMQSKTQTSSIFNFEIFARNLKKASDKFEKVFENDVINKENGETDSIFPFPNEFVTNHIVFRGTFERITMCIYGIPASGSENHLLLESAKNEISIEKLNEIASQDQNEKNENLTPVTREEMDIVKDYPIENLVNAYVKYDSNLKRSYYINKPNVNMVDKTKSGYIYYEDDIVKYAKFISSLYARKKSKEFNVISDNEIIECQKCFKYFFQILKILLKRNFSFLNNDCVFRKENLQLFNDLPDQIISIAVEALGGVIFGYSEIKNGLKLIKYIANSEVMVNKFVDQNGIEALYSVIIVSEQNESTSNSTPTLLKELALECVYNLITFKKAFERFMENIDKKKFPQQYFLVKEFTSKDTIEKEAETPNVTTMNVEKEEKKDKDKKRDKEKDKKDKEKDKDKDKKHSKKKHHSHSSHSSKKSRSRSRSISKEKKSKKETSVKEEHERSSSSSDSTKKKMKKKHKNIPIKNGYQILATLLISKKNVLLSSLIKNIICKISLMMYMKNFNIAVNALYSQNGFINVDFEKIIFQLREILGLLQKIQIPYKKQFSTNESESGGFLDNDYPFRFYWNDYIKTNRKFFKKINDYDFNTQSTLENETHSYSKLSIAGVITNEIAYIIESFSLLSNMILFLSSPQAMIMPQFVDIGLLIKNIFSFIVMSKGGINFMSKNFEISSQFISILHQITSDISDKISEKNLLSIKLNFDSNYNTIDVPLNKSNFEYPRYAKINEVVMKPAAVQAKLGKAMMTDNFILKVHLLQLMYFLEHSFSYLSSLDELAASREENVTDIESDDGLNSVDRALSILLSYRSKILKSSIAKQSFISMAQNPYFFEQILSLLAQFTNEAPTDYEGHISLIIPLLRVIFDTPSPGSDSILLLYGPCIYEALCSLRLRLQNEYDKRDTEPLNPKLFDTLNSLIDILHPISLLENSSDIKILLTTLNDALYNNVQKYNMNDTLKMPNIRDSKLRDYLDEYRLNIKKYDNNDNDYLESFSMKGSLINEIYSALKIINLSIQINPLLLIDCVNEHLHLALRYLVINSVNAVSSAIQSGGEGNKIEVINTNALLLSYVMKILSTLLSNLLSSHVDNYRDSEVIEKIVEVIINCVNFLFEVYSGETFDGEDSRVDIVENVQKMFDASLETFREICKFNTTIKLNFKKLLDMLVDESSNKLGMMYLFNFMLNNVNSEYTIEAFVEHLTKIQKKQGLDLFNEIESNFQTVIKYSDFIENKNILEFIIDIATSSNNDFLVVQCARVLLCVYRRYNGRNKLNVYEEITEKILSKLNLAFNKIAKINFFLLEEKDIESFLPDFESIVRILKFLMVFIKSDYKFLFIFHDVALYYTKLFSHFKSYVVQKEFSIVNELQRNLSGVIFDIVFLVLEGLSVICDSKRNISSKFYYESNTRYDLVEELPNKEQIVSIIKELNSFITSYSFIPFEASTASDKSIIKSTMLITKSIDIFVSLASNSYGQNIILSAEYAQTAGTSAVTLPKDTTPMISLHDIINKVINAQQIGVKEESILLLTESIAKLMFVLLYDLNFYENISSKTTDRKMMSITSTRLKALVRLIGEEPSTEPKQVTISISNVLTTIITVLLYFTNGESDVLLFEIGKLKGLIDDFPNSVDIIDVDVSTSKLPNSRKIDDKFDLINKYYDYYKIQPYGINFPLEINNKDMNQLSLSISSSLFNINHSVTINNNINILPVDFKNQINEFEKLLNWKKHRIFLSKECSLNIRRNIFDLDTCINSLDKKYIFNEFDFFKLRKKYFYFNTDQFEQYCNFIFNENLLFKTFSNISYAITSTVNDKIYVQSDENDYNPDINKYFLKQLSNIKINLADIPTLQGSNSVNLMLSQNQNLHKIKKKINSKINVLIYKPNYEKNAANNKNIIPPMQNNLNKEQIRCLSKVSGRNLSTHVDNVVPGQKVVNLTYAGIPNVNQTQPQAQNQTNPSSSNNTTNPNPQDQQGEQKQQQPTNSASQISQPTTSMQVENNTQNADNTQPKPSPQPQPQQPTQPNPNMPLPHPMMKVPQPYQFPGMNYPGGFIPAQPGMMMNPMMGMNHPGMFPNYQGFQPMMPVPMMGVQQMNSIQPSPTTSSAEKTQQPQVQPQNNIPQNNNQQKNLVNNLGSILFKLSHNNSGGSNNTNNGSSNTGNEGSKDPRIRKKK